MEIYSDQLWHDGDIIERTQGYLPEWEMSGYQDLASQEQKGFSLFFQGTIQEVSFLFLSSLFFLFL